MKGTVILSHGLESGPQATKVSATQRAARVIGRRARNVEAEKVFI